MITTYTQFEQGTPLWFLARLGMPTASNFKIVMAKGVKDERSKGREDYMDDLGAELYDGKPRETYTNAYMERGKMQESDGIAAYEHSQQCKVTKVAFVRNHDLNIGCSPDGLVGDDGGVEVKTLMPRLMFRMMRAPGVPPQHMPQIQGNMLVTGRQWWDLVFYTPSYELIVHRLGRDNSYIDEIKRYLEPFQRELEARILDATQQEQTFKALRKLRDKQFIERMEEEVTTAELLPWPTPTPEPEPITEKLRASLALED